MKCWKCNGTGNLPQYSHVQNGICFPCNGTGKLTSAQEKSYSLEKFEKGTKRGGKTKHLFDVNPKYLDRKQLTKLRTRMQTRAKELGLTLKTGFNTETGLRKLQEAYEKKFGEVHGTRYREAESNPKPVKRGEKKEAPKVEKREVKTVEPEEIKKEEKKEVKEKYEILNYVEGNEEVTKFNRMKRVGEEKLNFSYDRIYKDVEPFFGHKITNKVIDDFSNLVGEVEKDYPGLVANLMFSDLDASRSTYYDNSRGILGYYRINGISYEIHIVLDSLINVYSRLGIEDNQAVKEAREIAKRKVKTTLIHELMHAYHHQVLSNHDSFKYSEGYDGSRIKFNGGLMSEYKIKMSLFELKTGIKAEDLYPMYKSGKEIPEDVMKEVKVNFGEPYGMFNYKEYLTILSENLVSKERLELLKEQSPERYSTLKEALKGVVEL